MSGPRRLGDDPRAEVGARAAAPSVEPSKTICGKCGHPMHWIGCFAALPRENGPDGECACRNDVSELEAVPPPDRVAGLREAAQVVVNEWTLTIAEGGLVTIALQEPIDMLRAALIASERGT